MRRGDFGVLWNECLTPFFFIEGKRKFYKWDHKFKVGESEGKREDGNSKFKGGGGRNQVLIRTWLVNSSVNLVLTYQFPFFSSNLSKIYDFLPRFNLVNP